MILSKDIAKSLLLNNVKNILMDSENPLSIEDIIFNLKKYRIMDITEEKKPLFENMLDLNRHNFNIMKSNKQTYIVKDKKRNTGKMPFYTETHYSEEPLHYGLSDNQNLYLHCEEDIISKLRDEFKTYPNFDLDKFDKMYKKICEKSPHMKREFIFSHIDKRLMWKLDEISPGIEKYSEEEKELFRIKYKQDMKFFSNMKALKNAYVPKSEHIEDVINNSREYISYGMLYHEKYKNAPKKIKDAIKEKHGSHEIFKSEDLGEIPTPISVCERLLDKYDPSDWKNPYLKWLDMCVGTGPFLLCIIRRLMINLSDYCEINPNTGEILDLRTEEARYKWIIENMIYACEIQPLNIFIWIFDADPYDQYKLNVYLGSSIDNNFINHAKNIWKLDPANVRALGNPPYTDSIDLEFIKAAYKIADDILFVHPSTWLLDEKNINGKFISTKELIKNSLDNIELFNGNELFGIDLFVPLLFTRIIKNRKDSKIYCIDRFNNTELYYDNIWQINKFSNINIYESIKNKISLKKTESINDNKIFNTSTKRNSTKGKIEKFKHLNTENEYYICVAQIRGNVVRNDETKICNDDFYTILSRDNSVKRSIENHMFWKFDNENEANNFFEYLKTDFCRFCLAIYKINSQLECGEMSFIPWLDFSKKWTDEELYKYFHITQEEIEFINKFIPEYYKEEKKKTTRKTSKKNAN